MYLEAKEKLEAQKTITEAKLKWAKQNFEIPTLDKMRKLTKDDLEIGLVVWSYDKDGHFNSATFDDKERDKWSWSVVDYIIGDSTSSYIRTTYFVCEGCRYSLKDYNWMVEDV